jgi:hypothetical protein
MPDWLYYLIQNCVKKQTYVVYNVASKHLLTGRQKEIEVRPLGF